MRRFLIPLAVLALVGGAMYLDQGAEALAAMAGGGLPGLAWPANIGMGLWGLTFLLLVVFAVWQALPGQASDERLNDLAWPFVGACLANLAWFWFWDSGRAALAVLAIVAAAGLLAATYRLAAIGAHDRRGAAWGFVDLPISAWLAWLTLIAATTIVAALVSAGWRGQPIGPTFWAAIVLVTLATAGWVVMETFDDAVFGGVMALGFVIVAVNARLSAVGVMASVLALVLAYLSFRAHRARRPVVPAADVALPPRIY